MKPRKKSDKGKPWSRRHGPRREGKRKELRYFLIVCEGEKTEPHYFEAIRDELPREAVRVMIHGEGMNTLSLVEEAEKIRDAIIEQNHAVDKVRVVFDCDGFYVKGDFDNAISKAESKKFGAAWSNEAFELWYLLHFEPRTSGMSRTEFKKKLTKHLGRKYEKNDPGMYAALREKLWFARENAKRLVEQSEGVVPHKANPCTHVHELVEALEELRDENP
jgi:hypothetical protein